MKKASANEVAKRPTRARASINSAGQLQLLQAFIDALHNHGIQPVYPEQLMSRLKDRALIRFATPTKRAKRNGWAVLYFDQGLPAAGVAGDWSTGVTVRWNSSTTQALSPTEHRRLCRRISQAKAREQAELLRQHEQNAARAAAMWHKSQPASSSHGYLRTKDIGPHRARQLGDKLILSLTDFAGKIWSLQTIDQYGGKRLMAGARKAGNFIVVDGPAYPARVLICEGWATGCTLAELNPEALILAAVDAGNLKLVATGARNNWPNAELVICGDDDRGKPVNAGATAARNAAVAARASFALPDWPSDAPLHLSDFNDLANWYRRGVA